MENGLRLKFLTPSANYNLLVALKKYGCLEPTWDSDSNF